MIANMELIKDKDDYAVDDDITVGIKTFTSTIFIDLLYPVIPLSSVQQPLILVDE